MKRNILLLVISCIFFSMTSDSVANDIPRVECSSYDTCLAQGLKDRVNQKESVLLHFSSSDKEVKYNLFDNLTVRMSANICPPIISVYKNVNNINFLMDTYANKGDSGCNTYFANITGDGRNRDSIIGQLEIRFCDKDELFETCDQSIIYSKVNMFNKKEKIQDVTLNTDVMQNTEDNNTIMDTNNLNNSSSKIKDR